MLSRLILLFHVLLRLSSLWVHGCVHQWGWLEGCVELELLTREPACGFTNLLGWPDFLLVAYSSQCRVPGSLGKMKRLLITTSLEFQSITFITAYWSLGSPEPAQIQEERNQMLPLSGRSSKDSTALLNLLQRHLIKRRSSTMCGAQIHCKSRGIILRMIQEQMCHGDKNSNNNNTKGSRRQREKF